MKRVLLFVSALLAITASPMVRASDQPLTEEYIAAIRTGCSDALQGMLQVQKTEAATRVNRGREYEATLKLLSAFNGRVVLNKLDAPVLTSVTARLQSKVRAFSTHYLDYADRVDAALKVNCKQAPVTFYDGLNAARTARAQVATDVRDVESLLDEYQRGLDELKGRLTLLEAERP